MQKAINEPDMVNEFVSGCAYFCGLLKMPNKFSLKVLDKRLSTWEVLGQYLTKQVMCQ